jgi:AcrR family transcriptional regulator
MSQARAAATTRPAGRRKLPRAEREKQMLEIAAQVFGRRGFHAASMDEIARTCGLTKPMLYAYFGSKEGLYLATVDRAGRRLVAAVKDVLAERDPLTRLRRGTEVLLGFIDRDRHGWRVLFSEGLGEGPVAARVALYRTQIVQLAAVTLAAARGESGPAAVRRAEPYAVGLLGAGEAVARWWLTQGDLPLARARAVTEELVTAIHDRYGVSEPAARTKL